MVESATLTTDTILTPAVLAPSRYPPVLNGRLQGRGLYFGAVGDNGLAMHFNELSWAATCKQAYEWGIHYLHPKVAEGTIPWYTDTELKMLHDVAHRYNILCVPYLYCYGATFGWSALEQEARYLAHVGAIFGAVIPDIEKEWNGHADWAVKFGQILDADIDAARVPVEVYPDLFPNPAVQATPYHEILAWRHTCGWRPMVYFSVWTDLAHHQDNAQEAYNYVFPMWVRLNDEMKARYPHVPERPIYPIIEVQGLPQAQVTAWAEMMQYYGYLGYWYNRYYPAYASTVQAAPEPAWRTSAPAPAPAPAPKPTTTPLPVPLPAAPPIILPDTIGVTMTDTLIDPKVLGLQIDKFGELRQPLTPDMLRALSRLTDATLVYNPEHRLLDWWAVLVTFYPGLHVGAPTGEETLHSIDGTDMMVWPLTSGRRLVWFKKQSFAVLL